MQTFNGNIQTFNGWFLGRLTMGAKPVIESPQRAVVMGAGIFEFREGGSGNLKMTSAISHYQGDDIVTTSGSVYRLGTVDPAYEAAYPGAKELLLECLRDKLTKPRGEWHPPLVLDPK